MIRGTVNARREAIVPLRVRGPTAQEAMADTTLDTGYTGSLTLPAATITDLELVGVTRRRFRLADGSVLTLPVYAVEVEWDGAWRTALVSSVGNEVLLGMTLLDGCGLRVDVISGGAVEITPLPAATP